MFLQPLLQRKNNTFYILWVCVCNLMYPACNAQAPCCHLWPVWLDHIFPHYLINGRIFGGERITEHKMCFDLLHNISPKDFSFWEEFSQVLPQTYIRPLVAYGRSCGLVPKRKFSRQIFRKILKISWKYVKRVPICSMPADGRTDRHDDAVAFRSFSSRRNDKTKQQDLHSKSKSNR